MLHTTLAPCSTPAPEIKLTLANGLLARILPPKNTNTHGTTVKAVAMPPSNAPALACPKLLNNGPMTSGNAPPRIFLQNDWAASAEDAYLW